MLIRLGRRDEGERFLFDALATGPAPLRLAALKALNDFSSRPDLRDPERARRVLDRIDDPDPDVAEAASRLGSWRGLAGAEAKIVALLRGGRAKDPMSVAKDLARVAATPEGAKAAVEFALRDRPAQYEQGTGFALARLVASPDPTISGPVKDAFRAFLLGYTGEARLDQSFARDLASVSDRATVPVLEEILARSKDVVSRMYAAEGLAQLEPVASRGVDRLLDFARREGRPSLALDGLRRLASEGDADRIIPVLLRPGGSVDEPAARFLHERLGSRGARRSRGRPTASITTPGCGSSGRSRGSTSARRSTTSTPPG